MELNNETTSIQLRCMANETIFYTWERRNGIIPNDAEGINTNMLTLIDITPSDSGQYRCIASNEHGKDYSEYATVIITGKIYMCKYTQVQSYFPVSILTCLPCLF